MRSPTPLQMAHAIKFAGRIVGCTRAAYATGGRVVLPLGQGWSLALSPDSAGRVRVEVCHRARVRATMWCLAGADDRLAELVSAALMETAALAA